MNNLELNSASCFLNIIANNYKIETENKLTQEERRKLALNEFFKDLVIDGIPVDVSVIENDEKDEMVPKNIYPIKFVKLSHFIFDDFNQIDKIFGLPDGKGWYNYKYMQIGNFKDLKDCDDQVIEAFRKYMNTHLDEIQVGLSSEYRKRLFIVLQREIKSTASLISRTTYGMETKFNRIKNILDNKTRVMADIEDVSQKKIKR